MPCRFVAAAFRRAPTPTEKPGNPPETNTCQVKRRNSRVMNTCRKIGAPSGARKSLPSSAKRLPTGCAFRGKQSRAFAR